MRSRTEPPATRSITLRRTRSQPRSLLSIARLNNARSRKLSPSLSRARMAQTCLGRRGRFWPIGRPLFHGGRGGLVAGSWILDMVRFPSSPPSPGTGTLPPAGVYPAITNDCFAIAGSVRRRCAAVVCSEPNVLNAAPCSNRRNARLADISGKRDSRVRTFPGHPTAAMQLHRTSRSRGVQHHKSGVRRLCGQSRLSHVWVVQVRALFASRTCGACVLRVGSSWCFGRSHKCHANFLREG